MKTFLKIFGILSLILTVFSFVSMKIAELTIQANGEIRSNTYFDITVSVLCAIGIIVIVLTSKKKEE